MNLRYYLGAFLSFPLLPIMFYQGKRIMSSVPKLPEAKGIEGKVNANLKTEKSIRLVTIGESTIAGVGVETHEEGFTGTLAKELSSLLQVNVNWKVYARSGYTAAKVLKKIVPKINEDSIEIIVIGLGANDAFTLNSPKKWSKEILSLIENLRSKHPKSAIVFCNMPPIKEFPAFTSLIKFTIGNLVELLGQELKILVKEHENVFYFGERITLEEWIKKFQPNGKKADFFSDGVHPSKLTYQIWAKDIAIRISNENEINNTIQDTHE